jgi:hypothetical protein
MKKSNEKIPSVTRRRRRGQFFLHAFRLDHKTIRPESLNFGSRLHLSQLSVLLTQNFEIQVPKGSHLKEVFLSFAV